MIKGGLLALLSRLGGATLQSEQELRPAMDLSRRSKHRDTSMNITLQCTIKMHNVAWHGADVL